MSSGSMPSGRHPFPRDRQRSRRLEQKTALSAVSDVVDEPALDEAIERTVLWMLDQQSDEGYWVGELEGDTILESEYILLLAWMGKGDSPEATRAARYILEKQNPDGSWSLYPGGPIEISASVKAYLALKITGHEVHSEPMIRARQAILDAGGAEKINSFTRYYLALLGIISYRQCPAVPPEIMLVPKWLPFNIYEMSSWSRTILVPLSLLWAFQPSNKLPEALQIDELFLNGPENLPVSMPPAENLDELKSPTWLNWNAIFRTIDRAWKGAETIRLKPLRRLAIRKAADWILQRLEESDGLGAIFPPIIWSIVALRCLGYGEDSPEIVGQLNELKKLTLSDGQSDRLQPCQSPVWDTAIALLALREAGIPTRHPAIRQAVHWLLDKECRTPGDWTMRCPDVEPAGWFFEFRNPFYPDIDDTCMVIMALAECLPGKNHSQWTASLVPRSVKHPVHHSEVSAVLMGQSDGTARTVAEIEAMQPTLHAIRRGVRWLLAMHSKNGGWGAFDADNDRELLTRVPFADHNAMIDPPTADITARVLEMFGRLGVQEHPAIEKALSFIWQEQESDSAWYGRWGVNYIYGTWQVLVGLVAVGVPPYDSRLQNAADWLESVQQDHGGWGETPRSYDEPSLRGTGTATASQTAWALMGLMAAGRRNSEAVQKGIQFLLDNQNEDGTWNEEEFTGTGFPKVFYLRYHLYRVSFPLMALSRYRQ